MREGVPPRQWLIARGDAGLVPAKPPEIVIDDVCVQLGRDTPLTRILDADNRLLGCILDEAIDTGARAMLGECVRLPVPAAGLTPAAAEAWLATLGGPFIALLAPPGWRRIYPSAAQSCVYDEERALAASSPLALLGREAYRARIDHDLVEAMEVERQGWLPAGLTAHRGVRRLLPNHHLDIDRWAVRRHWRGPGPDAEPDAVPVEERITRVAELTTRMSEAIAARYLPVLAFTAGRDSRAVLAACRTIQSRISAFTIGHEADGPDMSISPLICGRLAIPHTVLGPRHATLAERARWLELSGHCVGGANLDLHRTVGGFSARHAVLTGAVGEVGRAFYWNRGDGPTTPLTPEAMLARMDLKPLPGVVTAMRDWLDGLAGADTLRILDLAYIEHRIGCWSSPQRHGFPEACAQFAPLEHRAIFFELLALPADWRRDGRFVDALVARLWPELAAWPYNRLQGWQQLRYLAGKLGSYDRVRRKLRRLVLARITG